jgi:hypothetical protein
MRFFAIALALSLATPLATAQTVVNPHPDDTVSLALTVEDWVQTQTVRTVLAVDAAFPGADAGKVRGEILGAVKKLAEGADWRFTRFDHNDDASGLERWNATLEARLPEAQLSGLSDRAKQASKPGLQITFQQADFSPTLAETEAAKAKLRGDMYKKINEALTQLNQAEPDRKYRVMHVNFNDNMVTSRPANNLMMAAAPAMRAKAGGEDESFERSEKLQLNANVTFAAVAPKE